MESANYSNITEEFTAALSEVRANVVMVNGVTMNGLKEDLRTSVGNSNILDQFCQAPSYYHVWLFKFTLTKIK